MALFQALINTVLPVFLMAALGWVARRILKAEVRDLAKVSVYILTPALIMNSILTTQLVAGEIGKIVAFALLLTASMVAITLGLGRLLGWSVSERSAAVLSTSFMNAANYGLPVNLLAFGQTGFDRAAVFVIIESLLMYSIAAFFAARGKMDPRESVRAVFRLPLVWAAGAAMLIRFAGIDLPVFLAKPISLMAGGAVPIVVLLLGMQVAGIQLKGARVKIGVATLLRLVLSPLVALGLVALLKPEPLTASVLVLESAMPPAVNTLLLAVQFDSEPDQVSGTTLVATLLSMVTVTFWVWFVQR